MNVTLDSNSLLFSDLIALNCGQRKLLRSAFHSWSRHAHWHLQRYQQYQWYQWKWNCRYTNKVIMHIVCMFSSSILQMMKKIWEKKLSKVKQKSKPVPALEQPRVCCSRSLGRPPHTSDNCLQIHIGSTHWPSRISIKFLGPYLTFAVS